MDRDIMHEFIAFAQRSGFAFIHLILSCSTEENIRRLESPARIAACTAGSHPGSGVVMEAAQLLQIRMEEEIGHIAPMAGLCGEYEMDTTAMDAATTAGVLAEYCLDTLRDEGWWIQLNSMGGKGTAIAAGKGKENKQVTNHTNHHDWVYAGPATPAPTISITPVEPIAAVAPTASAKPSGSLSSATFKLAGIALGKKKKS